MGVSVTQPAPRWYYSPPRAVLPSPVVHHLLRFHRASTKSLLRHRGITVHGVRGGICDAVIKGRGRGCEVSLCWQLSMTSCRGRLRAEGLRRGAEHLRTGACSATLAGSSRRRACRWGLGFRGRLGMLWIVLLPVGLDERRLPWRLRRPLPALPPGIGTLAGYSTLVVCGFPSTLDSYERSHEVRGISGTAAE